MSFDGLFRKDRPDEALQTTRDARRVGENENGGTASLSNSTLEGTTRRSIDFHEGDEIDEKPLKALIHSAVALNTSPAGQPRPTGA